VGRRSRKSVASLPEAGSLNSLKLPPVVIRPISSAGVPGGLDHEYRQERSKLISSRWELALYDQSLGYGWAGCWV
jgi:hypothetical protein